MFCILLGLSMPPRLYRVGGEPLTEQDGHMPEWQFYEEHEIDVAAPPEPAFRAALETTPDEILFYQTLTSIRRVFGFGGFGGENILNAPGGKPLLESAVKGGFVRLAENVDQEVLLGATLGASIRATINFTIEARPQGHSRARTETRVYASKQKSKRIFAAYWRLIYPGSSLIRYMWLRAIRARAERSLLVR